MFTCRMCNKYVGCTNEHKSGRVSRDGDSWAYWCDDFYSKVPVHNYENEKYLVTQSPYNYHTAIVDKEKNKIVFHAQTSKPLSKKKLKEEIDFYLAMIDFSKKEFGNDEF